MGWGVLFHDPFVLEFYSFSSRTVRMGRLFFVTSTSTLEVNSLRLSGNGDGDFSTSSFSNSNLLCFCVFWHLSSFLFWYRLLMRLSPVKLTFQPIFISRYLTRLGRYLRHKFSTIVGKGEAPLECFIYPQRALFMTQPKLNTSFFIMQ